MGWEKAVTYDLSVATSLPGGLKSGILEEHPFYGYSLCIAVPLMIFFGIYFLLARTPGKSIFANYLRSRRIMGCALFLLVANCLIYFLSEIRFHDIDAAILLNLSTYFLCYWLFSLALTTLLDRFPITRRRCAAHFTLWVLFTLLAGVILLWLPDGLLQRIRLLIMALWLVCYGIWLSTFTYWAVIFGVGCGLLTFLPDRYIFLWILSSNSFYIYLYCPYLNYMLFYERMEWGFEVEMPLRRPKLFSKLDYGDADLFETLVFDRRRICGLRLICLFFSRL